MHKTLKMAVTGVKINFSISFTEKIFPTVFMAKRTAIIPIENCNTFLETGILSKPESIAITAIMIKLSKMDMVSNANISS